MKSLALILLFLSFSFAASAKNLYVDGALGDDNVSYLANDSANPWATIGRAAWGSVDRNSPDNAEAAQAGDTVIVREGTYIAQGLHGVRYDPWWNPVNSGTSETNLITFEAEGDVILQSVLTGNFQDGNPVIGTNSRDYIVWDGFIVDEANIETTPDTGPVVVWGSNFVWIQNIEIAGKTIVWSDNHNGIRVEGSNDIALTGNTIYGIREVSNSVNAAAIMVYRTTNLLITGNEIFDNDNGIYIKGFNPGPVYIGSNLIHNIDHNCVQLNKMGATDQYDTVGDGGSIYDNIFRDCVIGIMFNPSVNANPVDPTSVLALALSNITIQDNTIEGVQVGFYFRGDITKYNNVVLRRNIVANVDSEVVLTETPHINPVDIETNLFHNFSSPFAQVSGINYNSPGDFEGAGLGTDLIVDDPLFADVAADDFTLDPASPALAAGITGANRNGASGSPSVITLPPDTGGGGGGGSGGSSGSASLATGPLWLAGLLSMLLLRRRRAR